MAAQATQQAIGAYQLWGSIANCFLDQSASPLRTILQRLRWNIARTQHDTGLRHKLAVLPDDITHPGVVDLLKRVDVLRGLDKGGGLLTSVGYQNLHACLSSRFD